MNIVEIMSYIKTHRDKIKQEILANSSINLQIVFKCYKERNSLFFD